MLRQLQVKNYAIIDEVSIRFSPGLNIITGETGAGKSILLGALGLVLGDRADLSTLYRPDKKCIIEAEFETKQLNLASFFEANELDYDDLLILRRELLPTNRSRAFINDTPVNLKVLQQLTQQLINVHRQFATLDIFRSDFQIKILDTLAGNRELLAAYQSAFSKYQKNKHELQEVERRLAKASRENDFIKFQISEINEIGLDIDRDATIQLAVNQAEHAEEIHQDLSQVEQLLTGDDGCVSDLMSEVVQKVSHLLKISSSFQELYDRVLSIKIEIDELSSELDQYAGSHQMDAEEVAQLKHRYDQLQRLYFKHQVNDSEELQALLNEMEDKIQSNDADEERRSILSEEIAGQETILQKQANELSQKRKQFASKLKSKVEKALSELAMASATFDVHLAPSNQLRSTGNDDVHFLFSANPGSELKPLQDVASGGELSRLSLALKSIIAHELALPTMVFDEIDSGVSGDTALRMGRMLRGLGESHQTIVITHSPQVAAQGNAHFYVDKQVENGVTRTRIKQLENIERKDKIAIMLSSDPPTASAKKNAQELLAM